MKTSGNTILVTGGGTGIGLAIAVKFAELGNSVVICGRRADRLREVTRASPRIQSIRCDITNPADRAELSEIIGASFPGLNMLVNNAGVQRHLDLKGGAEDPTASREIETNLTSQIQLSALFIPLLSRQGQSAIVNVTSGLGLVPMARFPIYSATKAAMHSFTLSLRHQLQRTPIRVFELIPPTVHDTELKGRPTKREEWTVSSSEVAVALAEGMANDRYEIPVGPAGRWASASRAELDEAFSRING
jgi:uncharacterized oxidoreductase